MNAFIDFLCFSKEKASRLVLHPRACNFLLVLLKENKHVCQN